MRLIDGDFPDYTKVIPKGNPNIAKLDHDELLPGFAPRVDSFQRTLQGSKNGVR